VHPGPPAAPTSFSFTTAANTLPTASVTSPSAGAQFSPGQTITITWTMSDAETASSLLVANLSYSSGGKTYTIAGSLTGFSNNAGTYSWVAPNIDASDVVIVLTVIDQDGGNRTVQSGTFSIKGGGLDLVVIGALLGIILAVVIGALLFFLVAKRRKKEEAVAPPLPVAPSRAAPPRAAPPAPRAPPRPAPAPPASPPSGATKECPSCGTIIDMKDTECFMCGHKF